VEGAEAGLEGQAALLEAGAVQAVVFLLFEAAEVVLDEEGGVELAHGYFLLQYCKKHILIYNESIIFYCWLCDVNYIEDCFKSQCHHKIQEDSCKEIQVKLA
jgi:hypothetical protein